MKRFAIVALLGACAGCQNAPARSAPPGSSTSSPAPTPTPSEAPAVPSMPRPGDPSPSLIATAADGSKVDLAAYAKSGKWVVVYFYPKDDTPGCTKEACAFRDAWTKLEKGNVQVVGVSVDDDESHKAFAKKYSLPFPLVADTDQSICKRFGVPVKNGHASRTSFLVAPDGKIKKVYPKVDPAIHADEILADVGVT